MRNVIEKISAFVKDEEGLTMVEYAVAGALITTGAVAAFTALGGAVRDQIYAMGAELGVAAPGDGG